MFYYVLTRDGVEYKIYDLETKAQARGKDGIKSITLQYLMVTCAKKVDTTRAEYPFLGLESEAPLFPKDNSPIDPNEISNSIAYRSDNNSHYPALEKFLELRPGDKLESINDDPNGGRRETIDIRILDNLKHFNLLKERYFKTVSTPESTPADPTKLTSIFSPADRKKRLALFIGLGLLTLALLAVTVVTAGAAAGVILPGIAAAAVLAPIAGVSFIAAIASLAGTIRAFIKRENDRFIPEMSPGHRIKIPNYADPLDFVQQEQNIYTRDFSLFELARAPEEAYVSLNKQQFEKETGVAPE